jgi:hypothetical protein
MKDKERPPQRAKKRGQIYTERSEEKNKNHCQQWTITELKAKSPTQCQAFTLAELQIRRCSERQNICRSTAYHMPLI